MMQRFTMSVVLLHQGRSRQSLLHKPSPNEEARAITMTAIAALRNVASVMA